MSLRIENLKKNLGRFTLSANFSVKENERLGILGPSGSGKSTLMKMIAGLTSIDSGKLLWNEKEITSLSPQERRMGLVFQDQLLFPMLDVVDNLTFALMARKVPRGEREIIANDWLKRLQLAHLKNAKIDQLSGGERQRVALVRAILLEPKILILDEAFSALDEEARLHFQELLLRLVTEKRIPLILITHDARDLEKLATDQIEVRIEGSEHLFSRDRFSS